MFTILGADGKEYGPVTAARVAEWIAGGRANLQTQARRAGETEWRTLADFVEFNPAATPPPLPAAPAAPPAPPAPASPVITLVPAGRGRRLGAAAIEGALQWLCKMPIVLAFFEMFRIAAADPNTPPDQLTAPLLAAYAQAVPYMAIYVIIQITLLCVRSQSIGKLILGMRIVDVETEQPAGPLRAFVLRALITTVIEAIPLLGTLYWVVDSLFIFREDRRCLHDLIAGTKVVKA
jgi:uncharacterized RDD family membrane protein YckC